MVVSQSVGLVGSCVPESDLCVLGGEQSLAEVEFLYGWEVKVKFSNVSDEAIIKS